MVRSHSSATKADFPIFYMQQLQRKFLKHRTCEDALLKIKILACKEYIYILHCVTVCEVQSYLNLKKINLSSRILYYTGLTFEATEI